MGIEITIAKLTRLLGDNCGQACYVLPVLSTPLSFMSDFSPWSSMPHLQQQANQGHLGVLSSLTDSNSTLTVVPLVAGRPLYQEN